MNNLSSVLILSGGRSAYWWRTQCRPSGWDDVTTRRPAQASGHERTVYAHQLSSNIIRAISIAEYRYTVILAFLLDLGTALGRTLLRYDKVGLS